jgi:NAD(P)-dependent dehydrogenase (short-subunit alcohol dehydrogenase family)
MNLNPKILKLISLEGKVAIITGGASGIGRATAFRLAEAGAAIVILDTNVNLGQQVAAEIGQLDGKAHFICCDVTCGAECRVAIEQTISQFGKIDILFNNAGVTRRKNVVDLTEEEWNLVLNVNVKGIYLISHYVIPAMIENGGGSVINTGSGWGISGGANAVAYCAAKGATVNMTRAMAIDHGRHNIRVNCICPGDVDTAMLRSEAEQLGQAWNQFQQEAANRPLNRLGTVEEIANCVLFLASDLSSWVTGAILSIDGGGTA